MVEFKRSYLPSPRAPTASSRAVLPLKSKTLTSSNIPNTYDAVPETHE